ncbi:MAG: hypothetical protein NTW61_00870 [Candidatus Melainabacteria bacterium]|nr:hypothetical protein [Candidatus Melainabacteria bacterium]
MEALIYNRGKGTQLPNANILGDMILKDTDRSINLSNRLLVTSNPTKPGVISLLDIYSHKHGEIELHRHFCETRISFPPNQQKEVESIVKDFFQKSKAEIYSDNSLETLITNALTGKNILIKNTKNWALDRYPDALLTFGAWNQRENTLSRLFITPPVVHPEGLRTDYFGTEDAQNSQLKSLNGQPIEQLLVFTQVNQPQDIPDLASKITATGRMNIETGNIQDTTPRGQKEIEGMLKAGLNWITALGNDFLSK